MTPATQVIIEDTPGSTRHTYCDRHFREALDQAPLTDCEKVQRARKGEYCEECDL